MVFTIDFDFINLPSLNWTWLGYGEKRKSMSGKSRCLNGAGVLPSIQSQSSS